MLRFSLVGLGFVVGSANARADDGWGFLRSWSGHGPGERLGADGRRFFEQAGVDAALRRLLAPGDLALVRQRYSLWERFSTVGHYLVGDGCQPHDCGAFNATLVFDLNGAGLWVMLFAHRGSVVSSRWFGTADYVELPGDVLATVTAVHRPAP